MRIVGKILLWISGVLGVGLLGAAMWFWVTPAGINNYVNKITIQLALGSPQTLTQLGVIDNTLLDFHSDELDDQTKAFEDKMTAKLRAAREGLDRYGPEGLEGQELLTYQITAWFLDDALRQAEFDADGYRVNQISGVTVDTPQFLTDAHVIQDARSVERYLSRLREFGRILREARVRVEEDRAKGVVPPDFVIDQALTGMRSFIAAGAAGNALVTTLPAKLDKLEGVDAAQRTAWLTQAESLVDNEVLPGYRAMIALFEDMRRTATNDAGIWRIPNGDKIYAAALKSNTTTDLTAEQIHTLGVEEVARIEAEMTAILTAQGYEKGTIAERLRTLNEDPAQRFANTDEGRAQMLDYHKAIDARVMAVAPKLSAAQLIEGVPLLRKVMPFNAYAEGWALYAERIAKTDMGIYADDPLGDLGRLQAEMFRAVRLVVDTGLHAKRWSREQAIAYMVEKTGMSEAEVTREIERYVVWPGQATGYKVGQLALLKMRADAERELGAKFDLKAFHEVLLMNGAMPLGILEGLVRDWITARKSAA